MTGDNHYHVYLCGQPACGLRFPAPFGSPAAKTCPRCGASVREAGRYPPPLRQPPTRQPVLHLEVLLDNLRSAWNVGSIFRIADGAGARRLHLCGITPPGDHPRVPKTALGAQNAVEWTAHPNGLETARALRGRGFRLWALETTPQAVPLFDLLPAAAEPPLALVLGNELSGVDPGILALCERHVYLPMQGVKASLNVATAFGAAAYALLHTR